MRPVLLATCFLLAANAAFAQSAPVYKTQDCNKAVTQMDLNQCAGANYQSADDTLNALYKQVMLWLPDQAAKDRLRDSERAWIKHRDKVCADEVGPQADGGSIWLMEMSNCLEKQTALRLRVLQKMNTCTAGVSVCNPH